MVEQERTPCCWALLGVAGVTGFDLVFNVSQKEKSILTLIKKHVNRTAFVLKALKAANGQGTTNGLMTQSAKVAMLVSRLTLPLASSIHGQQLPHHLQEPKCVEVYF